MESRAVAERLASSLSVSEHRPPLSKFEPARKRAVGYAKAEAEDGLTASNSMSADTADGDGGGEYMVVKVDKC